MFYAVQDATARAMAPLAALSQMGKWFTNLPGAKFVPFHHETQAGLRLLNRLTKSYAKPKFNIESVQIQGQSVSVNESEFETSPFCTLRHFRKEMTDSGPKLLIVAPLSGHHATLLRDTVQTLLEQHDVYITDWVDAKQVPLKDGKFDLSDYTSYVQHYIRILGPDVHVLAVCQPCVPALAAISLMEQNNEPFVPKSLTLIAGPVDVRSNPTAVNNFATAHDISYFRDKLIEAVPWGHPGTGRKVYPGYMQLTGFVLMNKNKHKQAYSDFYQAVRAGDEGQAGKHERFYDEYNAVLDMPAEYYLETIAKVFLTPAIALGELDLCGERVKPEYIRRTALLTIEGDKDDITGLGQTHGAQALCSGLPDSMRKTLTVEGAGHYGCFSGSKFKAVPVPVIAEFIRSHS